MTRLDSSEDPGGLRPLEEFEDAPRGTPESFAYRLLTLEEGREEVLTENEYEELRASTLGELTSRRPLLRQWAPALGVCVLASVGVAGLGFFGNTFAFVLGGLFALAVSTGTILVLMRTEGTLADQTEGERLLVVESLVGWKLITEEEAGDLRSRIHELQRNRPTG